MEKSQPLEKHYPFQDFYFENTSKSADLSETSISFDEVLSKIGFGSYQWKAYLILGLILINDGAEAVVLSILQNILKTEWGLVPAQNNLIGTAVFIGLLFGSLVTGKISDQYGRKRPLVYLSILLYIAGLASAFVTEIISLIVVRTIYGFLVGIQFPMCFTYLTEITPKEVRGKYLILAGVFFTFGELFTCFLAFFTLDGVSSGNWRLLLIGIAQPALICWLCVIFNIYESPRYLIATKKEIEKGFEILKIIAQKNNVNVTLEEDELRGLRRWTQANENLKNVEVASISALFKGKMKKITLIVWPVWFILCLTYYGMVYILPQVVEALNPEQKDDDNSENLWSITLPVFGEIPSVLIGAWMVEHAAFGRKNSMITGFIIGAVVCLLARFAPLFTLWAVGIRMILNGLFTILPAYTTELYPTTIRATGLGLASAFSRIGGAMTTWFSQGLFELNPKAPFIGFGCLCLLGCFCCYLIPYDTTKKELDYEMPEIPTSKGEKSPAKL